jgi:hypothetical protein
MHSGGFNPPLQQNDSKTNFPNKKETTVPTKWNGRSFHSSPIVSYPRWIASEGHTSAQVPHSVHTSGLIE